MFAFKNKQVIILVKENHLVEGSFITALFEDYTELLVAESAVPLLKAFQSMLIVFSVSHEVKLV